MEPQVFVRAEVGHFVERVDCASAGGAGIGAAVAWTTEQFGHDGVDAGQLIDQLIDIWSSLPIDRKEPERVAMLDLLANHGDAAPALRFLREVMLSRYDGSENDGLLPVLSLIGSDASAEFLSELVEERMPIRPNAVLTLLLQAGQLPNFEWYATLREGVGAALATLPVALRPRPQDSTVIWRPVTPQTIDEDGLAALFTLAWRCGLLAEAEAAAAVVAAHSEVATPQRHLPAALDSRSDEKGISGSAAYRTLWLQATRSLLSRSAMPPEAPADWTIAADIACNCDLCAQLKAFCADPVAEVRRFPLRKELRKHLHREIDNNRLDIDHVTERRGRPYPLVCTKNRASHQRRLKEYDEDVSWMRALIRLAPEGEAAKDVAAELQQLEASFHLPK